MLVLQSHLSSPLTHPHPTSTEHLLVSTAVDQDIFKKDYLYILWEIPLSKTKTLKSTPRVLHEIPPQEHRSTHTLFVCSRMQVLVHMDTYFFSETVILWSKKKFERNEGRKQAGNYNLTSNLKIFYFLSLLFPGRRITEHIMIFFEKSQNSNGA